MNRRQFWERNWVHITRMLPPETEDDVLIWNPIIKQATLMKGYLALSAANSIIKEGNDSVSWDRFFIYWTWIYPPKDKGKKCDESKKNKPKKGKLL